MNNESAKPLTETAAGGKRTLAGLPQLMLFLLMLLPAAVPAQVNYAVSGSTAYVTNSPGASGNIVIASTYSGFPVTSIGDYAFFSCTNLANVMIPDSVSSIGYQAFSYCTSLTNVTIPNSVTYIPQSAFHYCTSLTSGTIPNSVIGIGQAAFSSCTSLTSVTIPDSVTRIGYQAFQGCTGLTSETIPNSVTRIGAQAFLYCTSLTNFSVDAANSVYNSLDGVLFNKAQTTLIEFPGGRGGSYSIPNSATSIGNYAFYYCTNLANLTFLGNAPSEGVGMFSIIAAGAKVYYYFGTTGWGPTYGGLPTVMLGAPAPQVGAGSAGVKPGGFGFTLNGVVNQTIVVEASTNLVNWESIWTSTLSTLSTNFVDPDWVNHPQRFYRLWSN